MEVKSFTLAETLITLAIIGIVASLTIPTAIRNYKEKQIVTSVKKFYSEIDQAFKMAAADKGKIENYGAINHKEFFDYFKPYLKVIKECEGNDTSCSYDGTYKTLNKNINWYYVNPIRLGTYQAVLSDGMNVWFYFDSSNCSHSISPASRALSNICGSIHVDINGKKKPNQLGVDSFMFKVTKFGIYPSGLPEETSSTYQKRCNKDSNDAFNGFMCTSWVINKGNMDYLRRRVSW